MILDETITTVSHILGTLPYTANVMKRLEHKQQNRDVQYRDTLRIFRYE